MADSIKTYTGVEATRSYLSPQEFIEKEHIIATVDGNTITQSEELTTTTFIIEDQSGSFFATFGSAIILDTFDIVLTRVTPTSPIVDFDNGSVIQARDLNTAYNQAVFIATEAKEQP